MHAGIECQTKSLIPRVALAALLGTSSIQAALPPQAYLSARAEAPHHVQISIRSVVAPRTGEMVCAVSGEVVRRFRGGLKKGRLVTLQVDCQRPGMGFVGPQLVIDEATLRAARFAEVFLTGDDPPQVMRWQFHPIEKPSARPRCSVQELSCR